jgi:hypothetical protein
MTVYHQTNLSMWGVSAWVKKKKKKRFCTAHRLVCTAHRPVFTAHRPVCTAHRTVSNAHRPVCTALHIGQFVLNCT